MILNIQLLIFIVIGSTIRVDPIYIRLCVSVHMYTLSIKDKEEHKNCDTDVFHVQIQNQMEWNIKCQVV